ncbi:MAG: extracellular solute-binding protein [Lachnospiraceae bacterium]|nr:extracellular solute-binding protein [Lachnospiraceae bacterium]
MKKKFMSAMLAASVVAASLSACTNSGNGGKVEEPAPSQTAIDNAGNDSEDTDAAPEEELDYTFGEHFYSETPVTYPMSFSDASWYPMTDNWVTNGVFAKIKEKTNVTLELTAIDSNDYNDKIALSINAGDAPYIIPKTYDESRYVDGGAIVPVSKWTQFMPNFTKFVDDYDMQADLDTIIRNDGNFYRLPGMHESPNQDYTFIIRKDLFEGAGVDVAAIEKDWTYDDLYDALVKVKAYMVSEGICSEKDYIWSDLWCGQESGQGSGGNLLKIMGSAYGVPSGWAVGDCMQYDAAKDEWYLASTTDNFKEFVTVANKFVAGGILDPETFTQDDSVATNKFYRGETAIMSVNRGQVAAFNAGLAEGMGDKTYETYLVVSPKGSNNYMAENSRLENGVMISKRAYDELGEEDFIKMLRFVDWLFYSDEAYDLCKWGIEGETYNVVNGQKVLADGWYCGGLGYSDPTPDDETDNKDMRLEFGYAGGNFWYGHRVDQRDDNLTPELQDLSKRIADYRDIRPLTPALASTPDENEQINLWKTPLVDNINTWTLNFVTGKKDINAEWDNYIKSCDDANAQNLVKLYNEINAR